MILHLQSVKNFANVFEILIKFMHCYVSVQTKTVVLLRHSVTEWNANRLFNTFVKIGPALVLPRGFDIRAN